MSKADRRKKVTQSGSIHPAELSYGTNAPKLNPVPAKRDVHDFLDYCRLRAEIARAVQAIFATHDNCALVGYLTGSVGPLIDARLIVDPVYPHSIRYAGSTKEWAPQGTTPAQHYENVLDDLWKNGKRHFILADEYIGGGSIDRALKLTWQWVRRQAATAATFSIIAFADKTSKPDAKFHQSVVKYQNCGMPICLHRIFRCRVLLEMDKPGKVFNPLKKSKTPGEYTFDRVQTALIFSCPNGGSPALGASWSVDQLFGDLVQRVVGSKSPVDSPNGLIVWPESIPGSSCEECKGLLCRARTAWRNV